MSIEDIKKKVESNIDSNAEDLIGIAKDILDMPEPGYREFKTSKFTLRRDLILKAQLKMVKHLKKTH